MTDTPNSLPTTIRFRLNDSDDFLSAFAIRPKWTAFEAACLIRGCEPGPVRDGLTTVGVVSTTMIDNQTLDDFEPKQDDLAEDITNIAESIRGKWGTEQPSAESVVEWAIGKGLMWDTPFTRKVLGRVPFAAHLEQVERLNKKIESLENRLPREFDGRGGHHEDKRNAILGVAIKELATNLGDQPDKIKGLFRGGRISATGLATHLDEYRSEVGLPSGEERGFSFGNLEDVLRLALSAAYKMSPDKKSVTTD